MTPLCVDCWRSWSMEKHGRVSEPIPVVERVRETCAECGRETRAGIYIGYDRETGESLRK
jgi:hypothetical protein